jgi:hypothetical protein
MTKLSELRRLANRQPAIVFEMPYQFPHTHTTLFPEACKGNTVGNAAIRPVEDPAMRQICAGKWSFARTGYVIVASTVS